MAPRRNTSPLKTDLLDGVAEPLALIDSSAKVLWSNAAFQQQLGQAHPILEAESVTRVARTIESRRMLLSFNSASATRPLLTRVLRLGEGVSGPDLLLLAVTLGEDRADDFDAARLLSTIAHDLKNPIAALFGYADALLDTSLGHGLNPEQRDFLERSRRAAARASEMVRNYQVLASVSDSADVIAKGRSALNAVLKQVLDYTWRDNPLAPILKLACCEQEVNLKIDRIALERIIANLFSNALKFTPDDGLIEISTRFDSTYGIMAIRNSGDAIPQVELGTLFDRYKRGSNTRGIAGSGLGLFIVKQLVDACGGKVEAASDQSGTCFEVLLPRVVED